jgi:integrase
MPRNLLTHNDVSSATCPEGKAVAKLFDGEGLELWVGHVKRKLGRPRKHGPLFVRRWRFSYRFGGKRNSISIGAYPTVGLAAAREKAEALRQQIADGINPSSARQAEKRARAVAHLTTFNAVVDEWLSKRKPLCSDRTFEKVTWLVSLARPVLGPLQIGSITTLDVLAALKPIVKDRRDTARRVRADLSRIFNYAALHGLCKGDPAAPIARNDEVLPPPVITHRPAIVEEVAFGVLLRAVWGYTGNPSVRNALRLLAYLHVRPQELRYLRWEWVSFDEATVTFPPEVMKMREPFIVPLSRQAVEVLKEQLELTGRCELVFPAIRAQRSANRPAVRPISEITLNQALRNLGYDTSSQHTSHGFRASASTIQNRSGLFSSDVIEAGLAHAVPGVRGVYLRSGFVPERRKLTEWWCNHCDELREKHDAKVVPLRPVAS